MTLTQLRHFVAIVDCGLSVTAAALQVHATQSGLSKQIKQLEDELGFQLFTRRQRSLTALTPGGRQVLEHARRALAETDNIRALAANLRRETCGELRIATTHTQARYALPRMLAQLKRKFPQVAVHLAPGGDGESLRRLASGDADMAILSSGDAAPAADVALPLYRWERAVVVPGRHPLTALGRPLELADLAGLPLVSYESSRAADSSLRRTFVAAGLEPSIAMTARDGDLIKTYVRAGLGVGILAEMAVGPSDEGLVALPAAGLLPTCTTWLLLRRDRLLRDYGLAFIANLTPHLRNDELKRALQEGETPSCEPPDWATWHKLLAAARAQTR